MYTKLLADSFPSLPSAHYKTTLIGLHEFTSGSSAAVIERMKKYMESDNFKKVASING